MTANVTVIVEPEQCQDIREFLWNDRNDVTFLPITSLVFGLLYTAIITCGVAGNVLVVLAVLSNKALQSVRNLFIVSLSVSDIVVCVVSGTVTPITAFSKIWLFGPHLCNLVPLIQGTSLCFSTFTLMAIAVDRFVLIIFPTRRPIQRSHALPMIVFNALIGVLISLPMFFRYKLEQLRNLGIGNFCGEICNENWDESFVGLGILDDRSEYGTLVFVFQFGIPLVVIAFCYSMISFKIGRGVLNRTVTTRHASENSLMSEQRRAALRRRMRTNRMLIAMVAVFVCCWMPTVVFNFLRDHGSLPSFVASQDYLYGVITHCISMMSTVWNPVLYALLNEQFRIAFKKLLDGLRGGRGDMKRDRRCSRLLSTAYVESTTVTKTTPLIKIQRNNSSV